MTIFIAISCLLAAALALCAVLLVQARRRCAAARAECAGALTRASVAERALALREAEFTTRLEQQEAAHRALMEVRVAEWERRLAEARDSAARLVQQEREATGERFKALAADVLDITARQSDERSRSTLEAVLAPVRASLESFTKDFKDAYSVENTERLSLRENLQALAELNRRVSEETRHLTRALQGNTRLQGRWGEMVLKNILEASGLEQGRCLELQKSLTDDDGDLFRPDAIITCPDSRKIIIDSKVSLTAYLKLAQTLDEPSRAELLKAHARAVESHVGELRDKRYHDRMGLGAADFVLMFIPHEGAYLAAVEAQPELWMRAFDSHVVIVSPAHLVTVVKLVEQMWQNSDRNLNAATIAAEAGRLLEKLNGFLTDMGRVSDALDKARADFDKALGKLSTGRGSVLSRADRMRRLGAKAGPLPERWLRELDGSDEPDPASPEQLP